MGEARSLATVVLLLKTLGRSIRFKRRGEDLAEPTIVTGDLGGEALAGESSGELRRGRGSDVMTSERTSLRLSSMPELAGRLSPMIPWPTGDMLLVPPPGLPVACSFCVLLSDEGGVSSCFLRST